MDALQALTTRASPVSLAEPGPDQAALEAMLAAGARAPDHGRMRPWRFIVVRGDGRAALGDVLAKAMRSREPQASEAAIAKERDKPLRAPLIVVVAAHVRDNPKVPDVEQVVAAGAAAQNILVAAHALGFGGFWRTGKPAYDDGVKAALGLAPRDVLVGFLYLGTPAGPAPPVPRGTAAEATVEWRGV